MRVLLDDGSESDLGVITVQYVFGGNELKAKQRAIDKFANLENFDGNVSSISVKVEKLNKTVFWAIWSKTAFLTWDPKHKRIRSVKDRAIKTVKEFHRYIK